MKFELIRICLISLLLSSTLICLIESKRHRSKSSKGPKKDDPKVVAFETKYSKNGLDNLHLNAKTANEAYHEVSSYAEGFGMKTSEDFISYRRSKNKGFIDRDNTKIALIKRLMAVELRLRNYASKNFYGGKPDAGHAKRMRLLKKLKVERS